MPRVPDLPCAACGQMMWRSRTSAPEGVATCRPCRKVRAAAAAPPAIERWVCLGCGKACQRPRTRGWKPKWCVECRARGAHQLNTATCAECGQTYTGTGRKFCSQACSIRSRMAPTPSAALVHVGPAAPRCEVPPQHPSRRPLPRRVRGWRLLVAGKCAWCAEAFVGLASSATRVPLYCAPRCAKAAGRARRGRFSVPPSVRLAIYERDQWTCQLCSEPVDRALPPSSMWGATLDHIECQSWALVPDHSAKNLRLAHRWCNSVRGDETYYNQSVLAA